MDRVNPENNIVTKILRNIVLVLFLVVLISIVYNFRNKESDTVSALMADAESSVEFKGVFIRDEQVINYSGNGVLSYNVSDGGRLGNGSVIAEVYPDDSQISLNREIDTLTKELSILKKIQNPGTLESAQPANLSRDIEETYRNLIYCRDTGDYETIETGKDDLLVLLSTYQVITEENIDFTQKINDLSAELTRLRMSAVSPTEVIKSDRAAYFVSYVDGYESELSPEKAGRLTVETLREVTDRKEESPTVVGKIIEGYEWYLAGVIDNSKKEYAIGDTVQLQFDSTSEIFNAKITDIRDEGDPSETIIIVSCDQFNYDLVQHRCENVKVIKGKYQGLKVPRDAIRFLDIKETVTDGDSEIETEVVNNCKGVYIQEGEQIEFRKIDVIYEGGDYVLSDVKSDDPGYLALYDDIVIEGVSSGGE